MHVGIVLRMFEFKKPTIFFVTGPTAIGKTSFSLQLAQALKTQIISCDSRQFYKEMTIGTAVPTKKQLNEIPHHFIQHKSIRDTYTPGDYQKEVLEFLEDYFQSHHVVILVGGPSLYAYGLLYGLHPFPKISPHIRFQLRHNYEQKGIQFLQHELRKKDLAYFQTVDQNNPRRLLRALELMEQTGCQYSQLIKKDKPSRTFESYVIQLEMSKTNLYHNINQRVNKMMQKGLLDEVKSLRTYQKKPLLNTIGYKELFGYFDGYMTLNGAISEIKKNSRRFAKRQITFSKKFINPWIIHPPYHLNDVLNQIQKICI
ncbi:MAG: tRNA (adenosine(37)-N6)-dimethylallyltransferase MiaA [Flavobacteriaceae bacterium]|nr:tRNA (adenosine(37)-N6)-dimethylallyltransferase MiaA [Flavobacteriaceae bacterium]